MTISSVIANLFGPSPIRPLQKHMHKVLACTEELIPFFVASREGQWQKALDVQSIIAKKEHDADVLKQDLRRHLPKSLFLPVARTDVLELLAVQDSIANKAKDISGLMLGRKMAIPASMADLFMSYLERCIDASRQAGKAIDELDELLEAGFRGQEIKLIEEMIMQLDKIEHETDEMQIEIRQKLFELEKDLPAVEVIFLYKIMEWVGDLADRAQKVGAHLQILMAY